MNKKNLDIGSHENKMTEKLEGPQWHGNLEI